MDDRKTGDTPKESGQAAEELIPQAAGDATGSYSLLEPRMKRIYGMFYKELYYTPERRILDPKVQELISIAASLVAKCEGCTDGHIELSIDLRMGTLWTAARSFQEQRTGTHPA